MAGYAYPGTPSTEILEALGEPFLVYTPDWRIRYMNGPAAEALERSGAGARETLLGRTLWEQ